MAWPTFFDCILEQSWLDGSNARFAALVPEPRPEIDVLVDPELGDFPKRHIRLDGEDPSFSSPSSTPIDTPSPGAEATKVTRHAGSP